MQAAYLAPYGKWLLGRSVGGDHNGVQAAKIGLGDRPTDMGKAIFEEDGDFRQGDRAMF